MDINSPNFNLFSLNVCHSIVSLLPEPDTSQDCHHVHHHHQGGVQHNREVVRMSEVGEGSILSACQLWCT